MEKAVAPNPRSHRRLQKAFWLPAVAGLLLFALVTIPPGARRSRALGRDLQRAERIGTSLAHKRQILSEYERALKTDPFFNEAVLREKMKYRKPGEGVIEMNRDDGIFSASLGEVPPFRPSARPPRSLRRHVLNWSLLLASGLLVGAAFLYFDVPARRGPNPL